MIDKWLTANEIAQLLSREPRTILLRAKKGGWPYRSYAVRGGKERRYHLKDLPEDIRAAYAAGTQTTPEDLQNQLKPAPKAVVKANIGNYTGRAVIEKQVKAWEKCTEAEQTIAVNRQKIINAYAASGLPAKQFVELYGKELIASEAGERLGRWGLLKSPSAFYSHWLLRYQQFGLAGLVPQYNRDRGGAGATLSQEAKDRIEWLYLDANKPSVESVCELLPQYGITAGKSTVYRYIKQLPQCLKDKYRKGEKYLRDHYEPFITRDYTGYKPMEIIVGDYMTQDFLLRVKDKIHRAKLVAFMDMRSRMVVGWSLRLTADSVGVVQALRMCFEKYGLPGTIYFDNGREFKNYWICGDEWKLKRTRIDPESLDQDAGLLNEVGVKVSFAQAGRGQSKPIERLWGTLHERFDKFEISYTGSNTAARPDDSDLYYRNVEGIKKKDISEIPAFEEIEKRIGHLFDWYNNEWRHGGQGMGGRTPAEVWRENAEPKREIPEHLKKYLFTLRYVKTIQKNGIILDGQEYYAPEMIGHVGEKAEVRVGLEHKNRVHIFSLPDRKYMFDAELNIWTGNAAQDIERVKRLRKEGKALLKKYNQKKAEYDKGPFKTLAEIYAEQNAGEPELLVVGGDPLGREPPQALTLVGKSKKYKGLFDVD
jgi:putative transposase